MRSLLPSDFGYLPGLSTTASNGAIGQRAIQSDSPSFEVDKTRPYPRASLHLPLVAAVEYLFIRCQPPPTIGCRSSIASSVYACLQEAKRLSRVNRRDAQSQSRYHAMELIEIRPCPFLKPYREPLLHIAIEERAETTERAPKHASLA